MTKNAKKTKATRAVKKIAAPKGTKATSWKEALSKFLANPVSFTLTEKNNKPSLTEAIPDPDRAWVIELFDEGNSKWAVSQFFNLEIIGDTLTVLHDLDWCMKQLAPDSACFKDGVYVRENCRVKNVLTDDIIMAAVL